MAFKDLIDKAKDLLGSSDADQSPQRKCLEFTNRLYLQAQETLTPLYRQWYEQIAWVFGEHYLEYSNRFNRLIVRPERSHVPRATANLILDLAERAVSFLVKSNTVGHVVPEGVSSTDYQKAKASERIRRRLWEDDLMEQKLRIADCWCVYTGNAIFLSGLDSVNKPLFAIPKMAQVADPDSGQPMVDPETGEPMMAPTEETDRLIPLTEVSSDPVNPMEIVPDPYAKNPWEMRYWLHHRVEDIDVLSDEFGTDVKEKVKAEKDLRTSHQYQQKITDLITRVSQAGQSYGLSSAVMDSRLENAAVRKTFYRLPCRSYPEGEILDVAGGQVLHYGPYPYVNSKGRAYRNIHWYGWSVIPGCLWRFGLIRNLMDPQKRINGMLTQIALTRKTMGNPQWLVPRGAGFEEEGSSRPGKTYLWTPKPAQRGHEPKQLQGASMPGDVWKELETTVGHLDRISGLNDVLRGENPPGVDAGVSLEFLAERSSGRYVPAISEMRREIKSMEEFRLFLVSKSAAWASGKKMLVDEDGVRQMITLTNLDAPDDPAIEMEASTSVLWTDAAKKQSIQALLQADLIDMSVPENRTKLKNLYNASEFKDPLSSDVELAEFENQRMLDGEVVKVRPFENATIHLPIHRRLTLRPDYYLLAEEIRIGIEAHIAMTQDGVSEIMKNLQATETPDIPPEQPGAQGVQGSQEAPGQEAAP